MMDPGRINWFLVLLTMPVGTVLGLLVGAFVLQTAAAFCGVENLRFWKAALLTVLLAAFNGAVGLGVYFLLAMLGFDKGAAAGDMLLGGILVGVLLQLLISAVFLTLFLSIRFFKGLQVAFMQVFITLVLGGLVGGLALVVVAALQIWIPGQS